MARILVVDDDEAYLESMTGYLRLKGHRADGRTEPPAASSVKGRYDLVLLDIMLGDGDGFGALSAYAAIGLPVAMVSGAADTKNAVRAVRAGAVDVLEKPADPDRLEVTIALAEEKSALERGDKAGRSAWLAERMYVGPSGPFADLVLAAESAAATGLAVLLFGPSGSGKDPLARWVHFRSPRSGGPFVAINCAAIPSELAESELFGHRKGAFTGATRDRPGCFMEASGGTLFLDEIGEIPLPLQAKLLRAIESGEFRPVGADSAARADARIVCATNKDLRKAVREGQFREDLLYRVGQVPLAVPPLSARADDIPGLAAFILGKLAEREGGPAKALDSDAEAWLGARSYPGNVRELKSILERASALCPCGSISAAQLSRLDSGGWAAPASGGAFSFDQSMPLREAKRRMELAYLERQIALSGGVLARAADRLGLLPNNLSRRLGELRQAEPGD